MESKQPLLPAYLLSAIAVLAAALGSLVVMETATVKLVVPASKLVANVTMKGGPHGQDLVTTTISADVSDSLQGTATTISVPATLATGQVVFTCSPCPTSPIPIPNGTTVSTAAGVHYDVASGEVSAAHPSLTVAAHALVAGKAGNTAANTVTVIDKPILNVKVTNPQPFIGGTDAAANQVIQQSDLDRVQLALTAKVSQDIDAALKAQAEGLNYLTDGQPALKVTTDHKVGDQVATFNMTIEATLSAVAFSQAQADTIMRNALDQKLPKKFQLTADPIQTVYQVQKPTAGGDVTIKGTGTGIIVPNVTAGDLKARIRGMRVDAARQELELLAPGTTVDISVKPSVPWLPVLQDHINLTIVVVSAT
ncbi:MAG TPA: baseplate J/gp47 family protein [Candidatus Dormibacteraeota bacterium]